jgi:ParB-like chromosome segregation protein Spo0J
MQDSRLERVPIEKIFLAENYPFDAYEDYALQDLIEEIRMNSVIMPVLLRVAGDGFEIIDGRARFLAAKEVGDELIDAKIIDCSDEEIIELIAHTTIIYQRTLRDMRYSQQARIIARYYESLKKQGLRSDLLYRAQHGEDRMYYEILEEVRDEQGKYFGTSWASFGRKYAANYDYNIFYGFT